MNRSLNILKAIALIGVAGGLASCVPHLNRQQCLSMNWYQVGFQDGSQDKYQRNLNSAIQDCAKFKLTVDTKQYAAGWRAGAKKFCTPGRAYQLGVNGSTFNNICPANLAGKFNAAWRRGLRKYCIADTGYNLGRSGRPMPGFCASDQVNAFRNAYQSGYRTFQATRNLQGQINNIRDHLGDIHAQIQQKKDQINQLRNQLGTPKLDWRARRDIKQHIAYLYDDIDGLSAQSRRLNNQLSKLTSQLSNIQAS